ncbi:MAG: DUF6794 domain-containing protein [Fibrobacteria bacterium]
MFLRSLANHSVIGAAAAMSAMAAFAVMLSGCGVLNFREHPDDASWPKTVSGAVSALRADLTPASADSIRGLKKTDLARLRPTLGAITRERFGLERGNRDLFMSCGCMGTECCSSRIIAALWESLQPQPAPGTGPSAVAPSTVEWASLQKRYPGLELYLCGPIDDAHNAEASKILWNYGERSLCKDTASAFAFRLVHWKYGKGMIVVRVDTAQGKPLLVSKRMRDSFRSGGYVSEILLEKEQALDASAVDTLRTILGKTDWKTLSEKRGNCMDGSSWRVEMVRPEGYGYYALTCAHDPGLVELGRFLRDHIGLDYAID